MRGRDSQADRPTKVDAVSAFVEINQHRQSMRSAGLARAAVATVSAIARVISHRGGRVFQTNRSVNLGHATRQGATPKHRLGAGQRGNACCHLTTGERLNHCQGRLTFRQLVDNDPFQGLVVFSQNKIAEPLAHLVLHRGQFRPHVVHISAAHGQLGFQLRIMRPKAKLHTAIRHEVFHPFEQRVDVRLPQPIGVKAF